MTYNNRVPNKDTFMTVSNQLQTRVEMWAMDLVDALEANYNSRYPDSPNPVKFETSIQSNPKFLIFFAQIRRF